MMEAFFLKIFNMSITAGWLVLAVVLMRLLFKKAPKAIAVALWGLVGLRLICPWSLESIFSLVPSVETVPQDIVYSQTPKINSGVQFFNSAVNTVISETMAPRPENSTNPMQAVVFAAAIVWLCGIAAMLCYTAVSYIKLRKRVNESVELRNNIYLCDRINTPFILGVIKPKIYLPSNLEGTDAEYVVAHEKAHLKRRDHLIKPFGFLLLTVYWFNPILWVAYVLLCRDIELACDEKVIKELGAEAKKPYSDALINCSIPRRSISACPLAFGEVGVKSRIKAVLSYKKPAFWIIIAAVAASIVLSVCFLTNPKTTDTEGTDHPNSDPTLNGTVYTSVSKIYEAGGRSTVFSPTPSYLISDSMELYIDEVPNYSSSFDKVGGLEEVVLTADSFDTLFTDEIWNDGYTAKALRENNTAALCAKSADQKTAHYILMQKNGDVFFVYCHTLGDDRYSATWVFKADESETSQSAVIDSLREEASEYVGVSNTAVYGYLSSPDPVRPTLELTKENNRFTFSWSGYSSYIAVGTYELTDGMLTLKTSDGLYHYCFSVVGDRFRFLADSSSPIPTYKYSQNGKGQSPVPDGAMFEPIVKESTQFNVPTYDTAVADVDGDGVEEICTLSPGPTSGLFTVTFRAYSEKVNYRSIFMPSFTDNMKFVTVNGKLKVQFVPVGSDTAEIFDVEVLDGRLALTFDEGKKQLQYWGNQSEQ